MLPFADQYHDGALSLHATGDEISGLRSLPVDAVWKLDLSYCKGVDLDLVARFTTLEVLNVANSNVSDGALLVLHTMQTVTALDVSDCAITDAAMVPIASLRRLTRLNLANTRVTAAGIRELAFHPCLRELTLRGSDVDGALLAPLLTAPALEMLGLSHRQYRAASALRKQRPDLRVVS